jgi:hypothetical protein
LRENIDQEDYGMTESAGRRTTIFLKDAFVALAIAIALFLMLEAVIRVSWWLRTDSPPWNEAILAMPDPQLGHALRPNSRSMDVTREFSAVYEINENGLRDKTLHPLPKAEGSTRMLLVGDSFTFGYGNNYEDIWPVILEENLSRQGYNTDVVKAGIYGFDTTREVLWLKRIFRKYQPDVVVLGVLPHNIPSNRSLNETELPTAVGQNTYGNPGEKRKTWLRPESLHSFMLLKSYLHRSDSFYMWYVTRNQDLFCRKEPEGICQRQISVAKDLFRQAFDFCSENRASLIVLSIPDKGDVIKTANGRAELSDAYFLDNVFAKFAAEKGFHFVSCLNLFADRYRQERRQLYYPLDRHLNPYGNRLLGDWFSATVVEIVGDKLK